MFVHIMIFRPCNGCDNVLIISLLIDNTQFAQRVEWMKSVPHKTWETEQNYEYHAKYHSSFKDSFNFEILAQNVSPRQQTAQNTLPSYFGLV